MDIDPNTWANLKIGIGAAAGGFVRIRLRPAATLGQSIMLLGSCVTCGFYATAPVMAIFTLPNEYAGAVGALCGLVGLSVAEATLKAADKLDLSAWLKSRIGGLK